VQDTAYWSVLENQRSFLDWIGEELGFENQVFLHDYLVQLTY
jgi:hypothetical protein